MVTEWIKVKLGDIFKVKHGFAFKGEYFVDYHTKTILVTPGNFNIGGGFENQKKKFYDGPVPDDYVLKVDQIVLTMTDLSKESDTLGYSAIVPNDGNTWLHNQRVGLLNFKNEIPTDPVFINYLLRTHGYRSWVIGSASGTTVKHTSPGRIEVYECEIPPISEQKAIAHILRSLDDKIELNRRMNKTLEGMAQALFKSWFVDFDPVIDNALEAGNLIPEKLTERAEIRRKALADGTVNREVAKQFPSSFQLTEEMGCIPEGWEVKELENTTATIIDHRGKTPKKLSSDWANSGFIAVSAKNIKDGKFVRKDSIKFVDSELYKRWMTEELRKGDVLMTSEAPLGELFFLAKELKWVLSQRLFAIRADQKISGIYLYHWLNTNIAKADIYGRASGTTVQGIRQSELLKVKVLTPYKDCVTVFSENVNHLAEKIAVNEESTDQIINLRDTLLPKLISGELSVPDAEKLVEESL
jgi:type I restriction enzyme, S subunit